MSFQFNGLAATVTISGGVNILPTSAAWDKTKKSGSANVQGTTATDVIQSDAAKTWIIYEINCRYETDNGVSSGLLVTHTDSSNVVITTLYDDRNSNRSAGVGSQNAELKITMPIVLNNQEKIRITGGNAGDVISVTALGFEE